jgi:hypothetical protein
MLKLVLTGTGVAIITIAIIIQMKSRDPHDA